jgi:alpha-beta hydrolase superfamily lysophospholipase
VRHIEFTRQALDGTQLYFQGWEPETSPRAAVCLVHGLGEHSGRYAHVGLRLNDAGFSLLGFDLRGHGRSGGPRGHTSSYDTILDDISRLVDEAAALFPGQPRFLYGHSMGGGLVLNYALRRRPSLAGVIATSPWLRLALAPSPAKLALARATGHLLPTFTQSNGLNPADLSRDPEVVRAYESDPLVHGRISSRLAVSVLDAGEWALAHAAEFALPLLITHGSADRITSAEASREFARHVSGDSTFRLWEGFYHETHNEPEKAQVLGFMADWLREHTLA